MREELLLAWVGMLPATECSTRMMALTSAGWELINLMEVEQETIHMTGTTLHIVTVVACRPE